MDSRIDKLLRQRDLLHEHLKWIEEEIAVAQAGGAPVAKPPPSDRARSAASTRATAEPSVADSSVQALVPEPDIRSTHNEVRAGCLLYFGIASAAFGLLIAYIYWRY